MKKLITTFLVWLMPLSVFATDIVGPPGVSSVGGTAQELGIQANPTFASLNLTTIPSDPQHATTKAYVDALAEGLSIKNSVRAATTGNITLSGEQTVDDYPVTSGMRVLVKDQSTASENGIYVVDSGAWTRSLDADSGVELSGSFTFIEHGTVNVGSGWVTSTEPITLGSTSISYVQFSAAGYYTAGNGLDLTGSQFSLETPVTVLNGGTGATTLGAAPFALKGANSDITSLTGLTTALSVPQGGTASTYGAGLVSGPTSTSISGVTTLTSSSGPVVYLDLTSSFAVTLPVASTCAGKVLTFVSGTGTGTATLTRQGSDFIGAADNTSFTTQTFGTGQRGVVQSFISDGVSRWIPLGLPTATYMAATPSGYMIHYGSNGAVVSNNLFRANTSGQITAGTWNGTAIAAAYGGTGNNYGGGLFSDGTATTDTTGTVVLSSTSAGFRRSDTSGGNITYNLPVASSCAGKIFSFFKLSGSNTSFVQPNTGDKVEGNAANGLQTISAAGGSDGTISIISNGIDTWSFLQKPINGAPNNWTQGGVVYGSDRLRISAAGTSGQPLLSGGAGAPTFGTLTVPNGGTGSIYGAGLVGGATSASDTNGTVVLTASSTAFRYFNQGALVLTYELPAAATAPGKIFYFQSTGTGTGDVKFGPAAGETVGKEAVDIDYAITITTSPLLNCALISNGVDGWDWITAPALTTFANTGMLHCLGDGVVKRSNSVGAALSSATSLSAVGTITTGVWNATPVAGLYGGTGTNYGMGLVGGYSSASDTSGTVVLTASSAGTHLFDNGASTLTYELPAASTCPGKTFLWRHTGVSSGGDVTLDPSGTDAIDSGTAGANFVITATLTTHCWALISDGVDRWLWIIAPNAVFYNSDGVLTPNSTGVLTNTSTLPITRGGTGNGSSFTNGGVLIGNGNSAIQATAQGSTGQILTGVSSSDPVWTSSPSVPGSITAGTTVTATLGDITATNGNITLSTVGKTLSLKTGANGSRGTGTLVAGTATISNTSITANSIVLVQATSSGVNSGVLAVTAKTAATSFVVTSSNVLDTATFDYVIIEGN